MEFGWRLKITNWALWCSNISNDACCSHLTSYSDRPDSKDFVDRHHCFAPHVLVPLPLPSVAVLPHLVLQPFLWAAAANRSSFLHCLPFFLHSFSSFSLRIFSIFYLYWRICSSLIISLACAFRCGFLCVSSFSATVNCCWNYTCNN